jgi:hypothetical protein
MGRLTRTRRFAPGRGVGPPLQRSAMIIALATSAICLTGCASRPVAIQHPSTVTTAPPIHHLVPTTTTTATTQETTATTVPTTSPLALGSSGPLVLVLQQRLTSLGYWLGSPDGTFGDTTQQAVYALQKAAGITPDGVVGPSTAAALDAGVRPEPRSVAGYVIEIDLQRDLLMFVTDGRLDDVLNTSTGGGYTYREDGTSAVANTPVGHFTIFRQVDGLVTDPLGQLWRPKFFYEGFAIHGDSYVPPNPVSHGCVRVSNAAIDWIWSDNMAPIGTPVWIY